MYTLLTGLYRHLTQKDEYYVLVVGMDNSGKTTLVERLKSRYIPNYRGFFPDRITSTVGLNVARLDVAGVRLIIWDLGGHQDLHSIWEKYFAEAHAVVFVVDGTDTEMLDKARLAYSRMIQNEDLAGIPLLILVNKLDAPDNIPLAEMRQQFSIMPSLIGDRPARITPISAMTGDNVKEAFDWLISCLKMNIRPPKSKELL